MILTNFRETINKLKASVASIDTAEAAYWQEQNPGKASGGQTLTTIAGDSAAEEVLRAKTSPAHIDLAAG